MKGRIVARSEGSYALIYDMPRGPDGKRKQKCMTIRGTKKQAEAELRRLLAEVDNGTAVASTKESMSDLLRRWLGVVQSTTTPKTWERYRDIVEQHLIPRFGKRRVDQIQSPEVQDYLLWALENGRIGGGPLAHQTVHHHGRILRQALALAVDQGTLVRNPAAKIKLPRPANREMNVLSEQEVASLLAAAEGKATHALVAMAIATGARRGELLAVRWSDVDLDGATLTIQRSLESTKAGLRFKDTKTKSGRRAVSLPQFAIAALVKRRGVQAKHKLRLGPGYEDNNLVICREDGKPYPPDSASWAFAELIQEAGIKRISLHCLRHTFASLALSHGANIKTVQAALGHSSVRITLDRYAHFMGGEQEALAARLDEMLQRNVSNL